MIKINHNAVFGIHGLAAVNSSFFLILTKESHQFLHILGFQGVGSKSEEHKND